MPIFCTFAMPQASLKVIKDSLESELGINFTARESLYKGGEYYLFKDLELGKIEIMNNLDLLDNEPIEQEYHEYIVLIYAKLESEDSLQTLSRVLNNIGGRLVRQSGVG